MMKSRPIILQCLRAETRLNHEQIENEEIMLRLSQAKISLAEYTNILALWHRMYRAVFACTERFLETDNAPIKWLEKDLNELEVSINSNTEINIQISSFPEAVGYLYVFYGSQLGNQIIFKQLNKSKCSAHWPKNYFYGWGKATNTSWSQFGESLSTQEFSSHDIKTAVLSARAAFDLVRRHSALITSDKLIERRV